MTVVLTVADTIPTPNDFPRGLAWDGTYLWVAGFDSGIANWQYLIYKIDPSDGSVVSTIQAPLYGTSTCDPSGLAWDSDGKLWVANQAGTRDIYRVEPSTGTILQTIDPAATPEDLAWNGVNLWACVLQVGDDYVYEIDPFTGALVSQIQPAIGELRGATFVGDSLWLANNSTGTLYEYDTAGNQLSSGTVTGIGSPTGMAWDGTYLWVLDAADELIYKLGPATTPGWIYGSVKMGV